MAGSAAAMPYGGGRSTGLRLEPVDILAVVRLHLRANEEAEMLTALGRTQGRVRVWANVLHARSVPMTGWLSHCLTS